MLNTKQFGKNAVINTIVKEYETIALNDGIDFHYSVISPPLLSMSDSDLAGILTGILSAVFFQKNGGVFLNVNVFFGKMKIECKSYQLNAPSLHREELESILGRNYGLLKTKFCNNEFTVQIVFPI